MGGFVFSASLRREAGGSFSRPRGFLGAWLLAFVFGDDEGKEAEKAERGLGVPRAAGPTLGPFRFRCAPNPPPGPSALLDKIGHFLLLLALVG